MFLQGLLLGFSIAAPIGPVGLLCIQRTLARGRLAGFVSGLGAATADAVYGLVAALGLRAIAHAILGVQHWIQLGGAGFLLWLGVQTWRQPVQEPGNPIRPATGLVAAFGSVFLLTLANPVTILSFMAVFSGLGATTKDFDSAPALVAGVFLGSALWWLLLSILADALRQRLAGSARRWVNRLAGTCLVAIAAWILIGLRSIGIR